MRLAYDWGNKPPYTSYGSYGYQVAFGYQGELTTKSRCPKPWHLVFGIFPPSQNPPAFLGYPIHGNSHLTLIMMYCDIPSLSHINPIIFHHFHLMTRPQTVDSDGSGAASSASSAALRRALQRGRVEWEMLGCVTSQCHWGSFCHPFSLVSNI